MQFHLRTLLIVLAVVPPLLGMSWWGYGKWLAARKSSTMRIISAEHNVMHPGQTWAMPSSPSHSPLQTVSPDEN
jgi:hypothetical protein